MKSYSPTPDYVATARALASSALKDSPDKRYSLLHATFIGLAAIEQRLAYKACEHLERVSEQIDKPRLSARLDGKRSFLLTATENYVGTLCRASRQGEEYLRDFTEYVFQRLTPYLDTMEAHAYLAHRECHIKHPHATSLLILLVRVIDDTRHAYDVAHRDFDNAGLILPNIIPQSFEWLDHVRAKALEILDIMHRGTLMDKELNVEYIFRAYTDLINQATQMQLYIDAIKYANARNK